MATLENIQLISVTGTINNPTYLLRLSFPNGSTEIVRINENKNVVVNGSVYGKIIPREERDRVDIQLIEDGKIRTLVQGEGFRGEQTFSEITSRPQNTETSSFTDVSGRTSNTETANLSNISFPARRDGSESNQASLLDFSKMVPLREGSTEGDAADGEEDFNPQKYRVGQINRTEDGTVTAMIYDYTTNTTVGTYAVGQSIPEFGNRKVQSIDPDAKTVTLDDGSVISFTVRTAIRDRKDQLTRKVSTFSGLTDEQREDLVTRLDTPEARENNAVAVQLSDGRVAIVYQGPDEPLSYNQAVAFARRTGGRLPTGSEATAIMQNADVKVAYDLPDGAVDGHPEQGVEIYREAVTRAYNLSPGQYGAGMYKIYTNDSGVPGFIGLWKPSFDDFIQGDLNRATPLEKAKHSLDYGDPNYGPDRTHRAISIIYISGE